MTWGTKPGQGAPDSVVPSPTDFADPGEAAAVERALADVDLRPGTGLRDVPVDVVFVGSCTKAGSRICAPPPRAPGPSGADG